MFFTALYPDPLRSSRSLRILFMWMSWKKNVFRYSAGHCPPR